jgi:uncharacterized protein YkwD
MKRILLIAVLLLTATAYGGELTTEEAACFDAINQMRAKYGLPAFEFSPELTADCRTWSAHLRERRVLYHGASYENCAVGNTCGLATYRQWYASSGHRSLLLNRSATVAGIGCDGAFWTFRVRPERTVEKIVTKTVQKQRLFRR